MRAALVLAVAAGLLAVPAVDAAPPLPSGTCATFPDRRLDSRAPHDPAFDITGVTFRTSRTELVAYLRVEDLGRGPTTLGGGTWIVEASYAGKGIRVSRVVSATGAPRNEVRVGGEPADVALSVVEVPDNDYVVFTLNRRELAREIGVKDLRRGTPLEGMAAFAQVRAAVFQHDEAYARGFTYRVDDNRCFGRDAPQRPAGSCDDPAVSPTENTGLPQHGDADVPPAGAPAATVTPFRDERWTQTEGVRTRSMRVPALPAGETGGWKRILLRYTARPDNDAYDRLFDVAIGGVEMLRGTTPRTTFTVTRDITDYAGLLRPGATLTVSTSTGSYSVNANPASQVVTIDVLFFGAAEPTSRVVSPSSAVVPGFFHQDLAGKGQKQTAKMRFPAKAAGRAVFEVWMTGHGQDEEFWWMETACPRPRRFRVLVDGTEAGVVTGMPYVYALAGFDGQTHNDVTHVAMWWTAQRALDAAGVHTGVAQIPPYRIDVPAAIRAKLTGARTVTLEQLNGSYHYPSSLSALLF